MTDLEFIQKVIDEKAEKILAANDSIWGYAELAFHEDQSAALLCRLLREEGFTRILVLDDGRVVGQGTHEQLMDSCEIYREVYESQTRGGADDGE